MTTDTPAYSESAEKSVLGSIMVEQSAMERIENFLSAEDFFFESHQAIFQAAKDLFSDGMVIDQLTLSQRLEDKNLLSGIGGRTYLDGLCDLVLTATHIVGHARVVKEKSLLRKLRVFGQELVAGTAEESVGSADLLEEVTTKLAELAGEVPSDKESFHVSEDFDEIISAIEEAKGMEYRGFKTGFDSLDQACPIEPTHFVTLAARPGVGKSAMAMNIAHEVGVSKKRVTYVSLEMSTKELMFRLMAKISGLSSTRFKYGNVPDHVIQHARQALEDCDISIHYAPGASTSDVLAIARRTKPDLLVVDHIDLMQEPSRRGENESTTIGRITSSLKAFAGAQNCAILCLSQFNRESKGDVPQIHQLRGSGAKEQDSDAVWILHRNMDPEAEEGPFVRIAKNRHGKEWDIALSFDGPTTTFRESVHVQAESQEWEVIDEVL